MNAFRLKSLSKRVVSLFKRFSENISSNNSLSEKVKFKFVYLKDKKEIEAEGHKGEHILAIARKYDIELEGACDASLACSTCHVILEHDVYNSLTPATEEEEDLLDLAYGLTETSRLGCQTIINEKFQGTKIYIPSATRNLYVDGKRPSH